MTSPARAAQTAAPLIDIFVSVVAPIHNIAGTLDAFADETMGLLARTYANYELVLVDDGSTDRTPDTVRGILARHRCVRVLRLSRHFGEEVAIAAGLDTVIGDFVVIMVPGMDPPAVIPPMVERARDGTGVVFGVPRVRPVGSFAHEIARGVFYWYANRVLGLNIPETSSQLRVLSRQAVNAILQIKDRMRYVRVFSAYVGYAHQSFTYDPLPGAAARVRSFRDSMNAAVNIIVANSTQPLRAVSSLGLGIALLNLLYLLYVAAVVLFKPHVAEGWTTTSTQISVMFFFVFLLLAVLSEYVGRILNETIERPLYYVAEEQLSSVLLADAQRRNIVEHSADRK